MVLQNKLINFSLLSFNTSQQDSLVAFLSLFSLQLVFHSISLLSFMNSQTKRIHLFVCHATISLLANTKVPAFTFYIKVSRLTSFRWMILCVHHLEHEVIFFFFLINIFTYKNQIKKVPALTLLQLNPQK